MIDLTIGDGTQVEIIAHLMRTEGNLAKLASKLSKCPGDAEIIAMPDLGMPHNVTRIRGGFYTGALYRWECSSNFVPVDTTMNVDSMCLYRLNDNIFDENRFFERISLIKQQTMVTDKCSEHKCSYVWNFQAGNHFISYGWLSGIDGVKDGWHIAFHSSGSEFKNQINGLYPMPGNWYSSEIRTLSDNNGTYIRYINGNCAERFYNITKSLEEHNRSRHYYFASQICGIQHIEEEVICTHHYGMPTQSSVAIGCQWLREGDLYLLATAPKKPMFIVQAGAPDKNVFPIDGVNYGLHPHGLGKTCTGNPSIEYASGAICLNGKGYNIGESIENDPDYVIRDYIDPNASLSNIPSQIQAILQKCPGTVKGIFRPKYEYYRGCKL